MVILSSAATSASPLNAGNTRFSADANALIGLCVALMPQRRDKSRSLSTALMIFGLAMSDVSGAPALLANSREAVNFAYVLKNLAGPRFESAWRGYFSGGVAHPPKSSIDQDSQNFQTSRNMQTWLTTAKAMTSAASRGELTIADLIAAFWQLKIGRADEFLAKLGLSRAQLREQFEGRMAPGGEQSSTQNQKVFERLVHDHASHNDLLGFEKYAEAIRLFLISGETLGPLSISIQAPWGGGKSSLMKQVRHKLDRNFEQERERTHANIGQVWDFLNAKIKLQPPKDKSEYWTIWFNAWKYESSEQMWAGLVNAIVSQVSDRLPGVERELFLLRLNLARINNDEVRKKILERFVMQSAGVLLGLWGMACAAMWAAFALKYRELVDMIGGVSAVGTIGLLARAWQKVSAEPAKFSLAEYVKVPDYAKSVGVVHQIHADLQRVLSVIPKKEGTDECRSLIIFVDDLDRCSPNKVASIVEGINSFLSSEQKEFIFIIGMDPQIVAAALEHAHRDVKVHLPSYEQVVPLGWRFMDKFIQLAFTIPSRQGSEIETFVKSLTPQEEIGPTSPQQTSSTAPDSEYPPEQPASEPISKAKQILRQQEISQSITSESEEVRQVVIGVTRELACSPRDVKRILNFVRFVLLLRAGRIAKGEKVPALELYKRWIVLSIRWPDMARWLQWGNEWPTGNSGELKRLVARRLWILENTITYPIKEGVDPVAAWADYVCRELNLQTGQIAWLSDPDVKRFFARESGFSAENRLSHAAESGFY